MNTIKPFPLIWPINEPRTRERLRAPFKTNRDVAVRELKKEFASLGAEDPVITSNANGSRTVTDPGVCVYYLMDKETLFIACDKWNTITDNIQAIRKTVEAIRGISRWGSSNVVKSALKGIGQLPPPSADFTPWWIVFGLDSQPASFAEAKNAYFKQLRVYHTDTGTKPDRQKHTALNLAIDEAEKYYV